MPSTQQLISGITVFIWNGIAYDVNQEASYQALTETRSEVDSWSPTFFYSAKPTSGHLTVKMIDTGLSKQQFFDPSRQGPVQLQCENGYTVIIADAICMEVTEVSITAESSTFSVTFRGKQIEEVGV